MGRSQGDAWIGRSPEPSVGQVVRRAGRSGTRPTRHFPCQISLRCARRPRRSGCSVTRWPVWRSKSYGYENAPYERDATSHETNVVWDLRELPRGY